MKKFLLIALLGLFSFAINAQDSVKPPLNDTSQLTLNTVYKDVKEGLKGLGEALKVGADHVYAVLVKQQSVNAITFVVVAIIGMIIIIISTLAAIRVDWEEPNVANIGALIGLFCGLIMIFIPLVRINDIITGFVNPEYGAIRDIMRFIN